MFTHHSPRLIPDSDHSLGHTLRSVIGQQLGGDQALDSPVDLLEVEQQAVTIPLPLPVQVISAVSS